MVEGCKLGENGSLGYEEQHGGSEAGCGRVAGCRKSGWAEGECQAVRRMTGWEKVASWAKRAILEKECQPEGEWPAGRRVPGWEKNDWLGEE